MLQFLKKIKYKLFAHNCCYIVVVLIDIFLSLASSANAQGYNFFFVIAATNSVYILFPKTTGIRKVSLAYILSY